MGEHRPKAGKKKKTHEVGLFFLPTSFQWCFITKWVNRLFPDGHIVHPLVSMQRNGAGRIRQGWRSVFRPIVRCRFLDTVPLAMFRCRFLAIVEILHFSNFYVTVYTRVFFGRSFSAEVFRPKSKLSEAFIRTSQFELWNFTLNFSN